MSFDTYEAKKNFVNQTLSRCVAAMYPRVIRLEYQLHENDGAQEELVMIQCADGYVRRVGVTGLDLRETTDAVLEEFRPEVA